MRGCVHVSHNDVRRVPWTSDMRHATSAGRTCMPLLAVPACLCWPYLHASACTTQRLLAVPACLCVHYLVNGPRSSVSDMFTPSMGCGTTQRLHTHTATAPSACATRIAWQPTTKCLGVVRLYDQTQTRIQAQECSTAPQWLYVIFRDVEL